MKYRSHKVAGLAVVSFAPLAVFTSVPHFWSFIRAGGQVYVRRCTVMYVAVYATFGGYQPLLATLPDFALCMVHGRQIKLQNMFYIDS
jgi:hypothetical protein